MAATLLAPFAKLNTLLGTTMVHESFYPFLLAPTLHGARVSLAYRGISRRVRMAEVAVAVAEAGRGEGEKSGRGAQGMKREVKSAVQDLASFLVMAWGGSFLTHYMVQQVPMHLLTLKPFLNYASIHLIVGRLLAVLPPPNIALLDTILAPLDGALRAHAVTVGVSLASTSSNASIRSSLFLQLLLGVLAATAGSQVAGTLNVFSSRGWYFGTPPCLTASHPHELLDIIAAFLAAFTYGLSTASHPVYADLLARMNGGKKEAVLSPLGGKAAAAFVIASVFAYRAVVLHWLPRREALKKGEKPKPRSIPAPEGGVDGKVL